MRRWATPRQFSLCQDGANSSYARGVNANKRETVIRKQGDSFAFKLPDGHELELLDSHDEQGRQLARIGIPGSGGETVSVLSIEEREEEIEYLLERAGAAHSIGAQPVGYPWPLIQEEQERLKMQWADAGGNVSQFAAWRPGTTHEAQFRDRRRGIRRLRRGENPLS